DRLLGGMEKAIQVCAHELGQIRWRVVGERLGAKNPRVVDQHVDVAEALDCRREKRSSRGRVADIALDDREVFARVERPFCVTQALDSARVADDVEPLTDVRLCKRETDAARRAGDHDSSVAHDRSPIRLCRLLCLRSSVTECPATPQLSVSTSSITTKVVAGSLSSV